MAFFRNNNRWLRHRSILAARADYPELFPDDIRSRFAIFLQYLKGQRSWWIILLAVGAFLWIGRCGAFDLLYSFKADDGTPVKIIDSRAQNIATIISITLVVIGFIFNNLAVKETVVYRILFRNSWLYPILYFALITLGTIFLISMWRDKMEPIHFQRLVVAITFLAILILAFIGWLFQSITEYTNSSDISEKIQDELLAEALELKRILILKKYSQAIFITEMEHLQLTEYNIFMHINLVDNLNVQPSGEISFEQLDNTPKQYLIRDVNLKRLACWVRWKRRGSAEDIYYNKLFIGMSTPDLENYLIQDGVVNTPGNRFGLRKSIKYRLVKDKDGRHGPLRMHFDEKLDTYVRNGESVKLRKVLDSYAKIYELKMKYQ